MKTVVSAPGKVLVTGGYCVLERPNAGHVIATTARFYAVAESLPSTLAASRTSSDVVPVVVVSPQFRTRSELHYSLGSGSLTQHSGPDNVFIATAVQHALSVAAVRVGAAAVQERCADLRVTLLADNDYYSQRRTLQRFGRDLTLENLQQLKPFAPVDKTDLEKTGLGSSAGLVTSLVAALLLHLGAVVSATSDAVGLLPTQLTFSHADAALIHNTAQFCHCLAQGKIGSGFDVCAAVFGSGTYVRFAPSVLADTMAAHDRGTLTPSALHARVLPRDDADATQPAWDWSHEATTLPQPLALVLAAVSSGSNTPKMVSRLMQWRREHAAEAEPLWQQLIAANTATQDAFRRLADLPSQDLTVACLQASAGAATDWPADESAALTALCDVRAAFLRVRELLRAVTQYSGVAVEPPLQTELCDATMALPGVLVAGVPGAGGFDAIFAITTGESARERVQRFWLDDWSQSSVYPLLLHSAGPHGLLHESDGGPTSGLDFADDLRFEPSPSKAVRRPEEKRDAAAQPASPGKAHRPDMPPPPAGASPLRGSRLSASDGADAGAEGKPA